MNPEAAIRSYELVSGGRLSRAQKEEVRLFALTILRDPLYRENLLRAAQRRTLAPAVETMLYHYAYGKPPEVLLTANTDSLEELPTSELAARAAALHLALVRSTSPDREALCAEQDAQSERVAQGATDQGIAFAQKIARGEVVSQGTHKRNGFRGPGFAQTSPEVPKTTFPEETLIVPTRSTP